MPSSVAALVFALALMRAGTTHAQSDQVAALQYGEAAQEAHGQNGGFALTSKPLLGRYGLTAAEIVAELAPHLTACTTRLVSAKSEGRVVHEYYELWFGTYPLANAYLHLHHFDNRLVMIRSSLPDFRLPPAAPTDVDFLPLASLGLLADDGTTEHTRRVIADFGGLAAPTWEVRRTTPATGSTQTLLIEAQTGAVLETVDSSFDVATPTAHVFAVGPRDATLVTQTLSDLPGTGYLDGARVVVYAPGEGDPRAQAPDGRFEYLPDDFADAISFDQVQAYYGATRALDWFRDHLGFDGGATPIKVRVNDLIKGRADAALYTPPPAGPEVRLGAGNDVLTNLARDTDVVTHELGHHLIYSYVTTSQGESGVLHEGTSDYFAYAVNGDPYLGESIAPGRPYLRTAALASDSKYDRLAESEPSHIRGQYWSAVLWDLRQSQGEDFDRTVYASLPYLGPRAGLRDGFLALLNADRDRHPLATDRAESGIYGESKCAILEAALARGFAVYLDGLQGESCGLDLTALAEESRAAQSGVPVGGRQGQTITMFGRTCSVVSGGTEAQTADGRQLLGLLLLPLLLLGTIVSASRQTDHGRRHGS